MDDAEYIRKLRAVKDARARAQQLSEELSTERCKFNTDHHDLLESNLEAEQRLADAEKQLRDLVLSDHGETGRTKYGLGVQVKVFETFAYDPAKALEWAKTNMPVVVRQVLDTKTFDAFAKSNPIPGLVEVRKTPKAMIPSKIDLPDPEVNCKMCGAPFTPRGIHKEVCPSCYSNEVNAGENFEQEPGPEGDDTADHEPGRGGA